MKNQQKKKRNIKKIVICVIIALLVVVLAVFGVLQFLKYQKEKQKEKNEASYKKIQEKVISTPEVSTNEAGDDITVDFTALQAMNPDIYAWIYIPGTDISYPIVQSGGEDQNYYLNYTVENVYGLPGSIYTENVNSKDFTDFATIMYGHEMLDGSMFGGLKSYRDIAYWQEHPEIYIYTPEKKLTFRIFAAVIFSDVYIPEAYDFSTVEGMGQYITDIQSTQDVNSHVFEDAALDTNSKLLTLSTCISDQPSNRYLVEAYLTNEE
ncbi:MAG: class B sortase [Hespellia sp.]|nr:class B sortase [Hespellia sp.]